MKKLVYLFMVVSLLLALVPATATAHTEDAPLVVDLLAGQDTDIGDVSVWNDANTLYVKFVYEGSDCGFLEVHLQVDDDAWSEGILTKKGNPIPGQFEKSYSNGCFKEHTFIYNLADEGFDVGDNLLIAAHAALGSEESMTIVSDTSTAVTAVNGTPVTANAVLANEPVGYPNCASYAPDGTGSAWDSWVNIPGAHWIWNTLNPENPIQGDVVTFKKMFTVPGEPKGGTLYITADNGYNVTLNGVLLGSAQLGPGFPTTLKETTDTTPQAGNWGVASQGWQSVESYSLFELLSGENALMITAANEYMWNTTDQYQGKDYYYGSWDPSGGSVNADPFPGYGIGVDNICRNPGGLIFKATLEYYASGETAWGCGDDPEDPNCFDFPGKNWATYFRYTVQEPQLVCPSIVEMSGNMELLDTPPLDISVGGLESDDYVRIWKEFEGPLPVDLKYDLDEGRNARIDGPPGGTLLIAAGEYVCSYYVHLDNVGPSSTVQHTGWVEFDTDVLGLIISGGNLGTFAGRDLMFAADNQIGYLGTTYPGTSGVNYWRGFDVYYGGNLDDAEFNGPRVDFTMWVVNAHDSMRIILPALWQ